MSPVYGVTYVPGQDRPFSPDSRDIGRDRTVPKSWRMTGFSPARFAENIAGFSPSPDPEGISRWPDFAATHYEIVHMPMGYETLEGDIGSSLSCG
ncbi:MAG: hypothetical protein JOY71_31180 [Acetobacteraceae bacterium]|nr:hypothetical protein [Acetobacteraceae bacterium]